MQKVEAYNLVIIIHAFNIYNENLIREVSDAFVYSNTAKPIQRQIIAIAKLSEREIRVYFKYLYQIQ